MEIKNYGIIRIEKIKKSAGGELYGRFMHNNRLFEHTNKNFNPEETKNNLYFGTHSYEEFIQKTEKLWNSVTDKPRSDAVGMLEVLVTTTAGAIPKDRLQEFFDKADKQIEAMYGADRVIASECHFDETTPHKHYFVVPLQEKCIEKNRLTLTEQELLTKKILENGITIMKKPKSINKRNKSKREKELEKQYEIYKKMIFPIKTELGLTQTKRVLDCQNIMGSKYCLSYLQDLWFKNVFESFGLLRGEVSENCKHNERSSLKKQAQNQIKRQKELLYEEQQLSKEKNELQQSKNDLNANWDNYNKKNDYLTILNSELEEKDLHNKKWETDLSNREKSLKSAQDKYSSEREQFQQEKTDLDIRQNRQKNNDKNVDGFLLSKGIEDKDSSYFDLKVEIPELLEPDDGFLFSEGRADYAIRNLENFKTKIEKFLVKAKEKFNILVTCVKSLFRENKKLKKELVEQHTKDVNAGKAAVKKAVEEQAQTFSTQLKAKDSEISNLKKNLNGWEQNNAHVFGVGEITNMFSNATADDFDSIASNMRARKAKNFRHYYEIDQEYCLARHFEYAREIREQSLGIHR